MAENEQNESGNRKDKLLARAKTFFTDCETRDADWRARCLSDLEFLAGTPDEPAGQWGQQALSDRARRGRPAIVINRLDQFVQHVANSQRQNRVSARVFPVDDKADKETAKVFQGTIRHIENNSGGTLAYDTAEFYAVAMGVGYWLLNTEYCDPMSFEQDIRLDRIPNPFSIYLGAHTKPDGSDATEGMKFTSIPKDEYKAKYPNSDLASINDWRGTGDGEPPGWIDDKQCRVAEFYYMDWSNDTLVRMQGGSTKLKKELADGEEAQIQIGEDGEPVQRETAVPTVRWCKLNALEVLDETVWVIPQLPIVKVTGHEMNVNGRTILKGIVRNLKDAQRMFNKAVSDEAELLDSSKSQVVAVEGDIEGHETEWKNLSQQQILTRKGMDVAGKPVEAPYRLPPNMSIAAASNVRMMLSEDLKAMAGIYDAALGRQSNEKSGKAILARQSQSDIANFHFQDNLTFSITHSTRMLVEMIPKIYDTERVLRIIGEDDSQKVVVVNAAWKEAWKEHGQDRAYKLDIGKYDVVCTAGPSFSTKRQEASEMLVQLAGVDPGLMATAPDIVYRAIDVPYAEEIAERRKKALPPELQDSDGQKPQIPPQVAQQLQQMSQMTEALTQALNAANQREQAKTLELESKERIEAAKLEHQLKLEVMKIEAANRVTAAELESAEAIAALKADVEAMKAKVNWDAGEATREADRFASTVAEQ